MIDWELGPLQTDFHEDVNELLPLIQEVLALVFKDGAFNLHCTILLSPHKSLNVGAIIALAIMVEFMWPWIALRYSQWTSMIVRSCAADKNKH
jgi:hypothetical protein